MEKNNFMAYDIWNRDLPDIIVNKVDLIATSIMYPLPTRMALGRVVTWEEFEIYREMILAKPLP